MSRKRQSMQKIINQINKDLDKIDIYKVGKSLEKEKQSDFESRKENDEKSFSSLNSQNTITSQMTQMTFVSEPFNEEKDLDLPNFSPMKYTDFHWRLSHSLTYMIYCILLLISSFFWLEESEEESQFNNLMLVSHIFYFLSTFIQWFYFRRGCIAESNYNSRVKGNIDKSFKAKILRSEEGWKYFFSLFASIILILSNIYYITYTKKSEQEYWNINLIGCMIISLSQILKLEKILTDNKQYSVSNDLSHCLIEIFMFFGSLSYGAYYFLQIMYNYDTENLKYLFIILKFAGNIFIVFSGLCLLNRYFCSGFDDLNVSSLSNVTL